MTTTFWIDDETSKTLSRQHRSAVASKLAWWGSAAAGAVLTNIALLMGLLYWFSILE